MCPRECPTHPLSIARVACSPPVSSHSGRNTMLKLRKGFTLIELLIVVVIIGILAAIAIPKFANTKGKAYVTAMKSDLRNLVTAEEAFFADSSKYSTKVTSKVGGVACTPAAGDVSWCP